MPTPEVNSGSWDKVAPVLVELQSNILTLRVDTSVVAICEQPVGAQANIFIAFLEHTNRRTLK
ncbi:unnamed protein product [Haemonchus placei]|uniref:Proteasome assembly chaperone 3 n=1 Tax=Haemonchus placei TaxID=6290 RepID=A0A0N4WU09_HAEPC|nr:unnamed protein product [Haemonchus placei]